MRIDSVAITTASTAAIALLAGVQAYISWRQRKVMTDQLTAMKAQLSEMTATSGQTKQAADAAKKSADALINSERAWVIVDAGSPRVSNGPTPERAGGGRPFTTVSIELGCKNDGRTPAWIVAMLACIKVVHDVSWLPETPNTGEMQAVKQGYEPLGVSRRAETSCALTRWLDRTERDGDVIVLCGVVQYRDALSDNYHETYFGFKVGRMTGPLTGSADTESQRLPHAAYNRAT